MSWLQPQLNSCSRIAVVAGVVECIVDVVAVAMVVVVFVRVFEVIVGAAVVVVFAIVYS